MFIDSHAHVCFKDFKADVFSILDGAAAAGVGILINVGTDLADSREVVQMSHHQKKSPSIYAVVGIHPHEVAKISDADLLELKKLAQDEKVVAVGEVGLDYYYEHSPAETQRQRLRDLIRIAREVGKPLVIHCRDAFEDCFKIFDEEKAWELGGVFHCYTGDLPTAEFITKKGFYVSFSGIVTFKKSTVLQDVVKNLSNDRFLIETDCPFLTPEPHRGKRNEPAYVTLVAKKVAELRGVSVSEIETLTEKNTRSVFRLP